MASATRWLKVLAVMFAFAPPSSFANEQMRLDPAPLNLRDVTSLQRGARNFVNYCLTCHSAEYMRYSRLTDLGLTEQEIKDNLLLTGAKYGETMVVAMDKKDAKQWFEVAPPDLSVIARSRGADWLYTYLRSFYRDDSRSTGWNNLLFHNVAMPHALYQLQGVQALQVSKKEGEEGTEEGKTLVLEQAGQLSPRDYDIFVADLVNYLVYMGEPAATTRTQVGIVVLFFMVGFFVLALLLKQEYWKDVKK